MDLWRKRSHWFCDSGRTTNPQHSGHVPPWCSAPGRHSGVAPIVGHGMLAWLEFLDDLVLALVILQGAGAVHSVKCQFWLRLDSSICCCRSCCFEFWTACFRLRLLKIELEIRLTNNVASLLIKCSSRMELHVRNFLFCFLFKTQILLFAKLLEFNFSFSVNPCSFMNALSFQRTDLIPTRFSFV